MSKRFTETTLWQQDWFIDLPIEYKLFWFYLKDSCDHAGVFKVNITQFCRLNQIEINSDKAFILFNTDKERLLKIKDNVWILKDFFKFQYGGSMNIKNKVHESAYKIYNELGINLTQLDLNLTSNSPLKDLNKGLKDKEEDKVKVKVKDKVKETCSFSAKNPRTINPTLNINENKVGLDELLYEDIKVWNDFAKKYNLSIISGTQINHSYLEIYDELKQREYDKIDYNKIIQLVIESNLLKQDYQYKPKNLTFYWFMKKTDGIYNLDFLYTKSKHFGEYKDFDNNFNKPISTPPTPTKTVIIQKRPEPEEKHEISPDMKKQLEDIKLNWGAQYEQK